MLIDFREAEAPDRWSADVVIAGTGPAGLSLAFELARAGRTVLLLEGGGPAFDPDSQAIYNAESRGRQYPVAATRLRQFGGTTGHWAGQCGRLRAYDLQRKEWNAEDIGWAIPYEELLRYYPKAFDFLELGSNDAGEFLAGVIPVAGDGVPYLFEYSQAWKFRSPTPVRLGDRLSSVERHDMISCVLHANVVDCDRTADGTHVTAFRFRTLDGREGSATGRCFVLACGGLENPRLLLNMLDRGALGEPSASRHLGRYFQEHPYATISTIAPSDAGEAYLRFSGTYFPDAHGSSSAWRPFVPVPTTIQQEHQIGAASLRFYPPPSALRRFVPPSVGGNLFESSYLLTRNIDEIAYDYLRKRLGLAPDDDPSSYFRVYTEVEQAPKSTNAITLSDARDRLGLRTLRLDWQVTADEARTARVAAQELGRFLAQRRLGRLNVEAWLAGEAQPENAIDWGISAHHMGTTRMAEGPDYGVVDTDLKYFGVDNLYVAGSSVFPSSGYANPTLTITAMSHRLADHVVDTLRTNPTL